MNPSINERLNVISSQKPELISTRAKELLNLRRLPAKLISRSPPPCYIL